MAIFYRFPFVWKAAAAGVVYGSDLDLAVVG